MEPPIDIVDRHPLTIEVEADTCDACGVPAFLYAELPSGRTLGYCGHHGNKYEPTLIAQGARIVDLRHLIPK